MSSLCLSFPGSLGALGIGQGGLKIARSMARRGWEVTVVAEKASGIDGNVDPGPGVTVRGVRSTRYAAAAVKTPARRRPDWMLSMTYLAFDRMARRQLVPADVFYGYSQACLRTQRRAHELGSCTVVHAATSHLEELRDILDRAYRELDAGRSPIGDATVQRARAEYNEADTIRAQSSMVARSLVENGVDASKVVLVPPAVDLESLKPRQGPDPTIFTIAFVGAFSVRKGVHVLLNAWDLLASADARLILLGGFDSRWSKKLVEGYGARPGIDVRAGTPQPTYADASVCVVPSLEDGFCYVVLEAMACGLPVIVSDKVGAKDAIDDGVEGFIVPAGDAGSIADRLRFLKAHPDVASEMGRAARRRAEAYTFEAEGARLAAAFNGRIGERGAA